MRELARPGGVAILVTILLLVGLAGCGEVEREVAVVREEGVLAAPMNLDFESSYTTHEDYWWDPSGGPYVTVFAEVNPAIYWAADWYEGFRCSGTPVWMSGRPEVGLISKSVDAGRVYSGEQALRVFTLHRCHTAGVHQRFQVEPGKVYRLMAYGHSWYSNCSLKPHHTECALDWDCKSCVSVDHELGVGLDPLGGVDPYSPSVVWSRPHVIYGEYGEALVVIAKATSDVMTAHLFGVAPLPLRHNDDYWDDVRIEEVELYYWPVVMRDAPAGDAPAGRLYDGKGGG